MLSTRILLVSLVTFVTPSLSYPAPGSLNEHVDSTKAGYLGVYWNTANETVRFAVSTNNSPVGFKAVRNGESIIIPKLGSTAIRDTSIIAGAGTQAGKKWYIIGTDLRISQTNWDASQRTGSRGIFVWESTDLVHWTDERLVTVEDATAGMVWAPDAVWNPVEGKYFVHWASRFYSEGDPKHTGNSTTPLVLRYAHTTDFKTFTKPQTYINKGHDVLDLAFLPVDTKTFIRYYADSGGPVAEVSTNGLLGTWNRPAGIIAQHYEGPYAFWDNAVKDKAWLISDLVGGSAGLRAWSTTDVKSGKFVQDKSSDITFMRHGSVVPLTQAQYNALLAL